MIDNTSGNFYKLDESGTMIEKVTKTGHCWPFRAYFKLPNGASAKYSCMWGDMEDLPTQVEFVDADGTTTVTPMYNVFGQQVPANTKGVIIKEGKKYVRK